MEKKVATKKTVPASIKDGSRDNQGQPEGQGKPTPQKAERKIPIKKAKPKKKALKPKKIGRPSKYTFELSEKIILKIAGSANGLDKICRETPEFPDTETVRKWLNENAEFLGRYTRARGEQADFIADEIMQISDTLAEKVNKTSEDVQAARLQVDSRKWIAAKLKPKKYGDKTDITTDGESLNNGFYEFLKQASLTNMSGKD